MSPVKSAAAAEVQLIEQVKKLLLDKKGVSAWILFRNGTFVTTSADEWRKRGKDASVVEMKKHLEENGPVVAGCPLGDFNPIQLSEPVGCWLVLFDSDRIVTFVPEERASGFGGDPMATGLYGRSKRAQDAKEMEVIYVCEP